MSRDFLIQALNLLDEVDGPSWDFVVVHYTLQIMLEKCRLLTILPDLDDSNFGSSAVADCV
jgi:hypothetical protein